MCAGREVLKGIDDINLTWSLTEKGKTKTGWINLTSVKGIGI